MGPVKTAVKSGAFVILLSATMTALAACGPSPAPSAQPSASPLAPTAATAPSSQALTPTPTATPKSAYMLDGSYTAMGHFLRHGDSFIGNSSSATVFLPGTGIITLSSASLFADKSMTAWDIASIGTVDDPEIGILVDYRVPAQGLEPEKYRAGVAAYSPKTQSIGPIRTIAEASGPDGLPNRILESAGNVIAVAASGSQQTARIEGYDAMTGSKIWAEQGYYVADSFTSKTGSGVVSMWYRPSEPDPGLCDRAIVVDVASGKIVKQTDEKPNPGCSGVGQYEILAPGRAGFFPYTPGQDFRPACVILSTGAGCALTGKERSDPSGREAFRSDNAFFGVVDSDTGNPIWSLPVDKAKALSPSFHTLNGDYLYIRTTDQEVVVNVKDGTSSTNSSGDYPLANVDGWVLWHSGLVEFGSTGPMPTTSPSRAITPSATPTGYGYRSSSPSPSPSW